jgi:hypothetical protein
MGRTPGFQSDETMGIRAARLYQLQMVGGFKRRSSQRSVRENVALRRTSVEGERSEIGGYGN